MLKNYLKIAWRNLLKNKAFSFLNITGLAIGMGSAMLILLWIQNEVSFDKFHANRDNIYEAWNRGISSGKLDCWNSTPNPLGPALRQEYPEVADVTRTISTWLVAGVGDKKLSSQSLIVDSTFLSIFSFPLVEGNPKTALNNPSSIVITEKMAKKMFGDVSPMNKVIKIDHTNFTVSGILKDLPTNTRFEFEYLLPWSYIKILGWPSESWGNNSVNTFVALKDHTDAAALNDKIKSISQRHSKGDVKQDIFLYPLAKWHLYSRFENGVATGGQIETVRLFGLVAAFILLIACINFMNLSTARSEKRAKEVGIRKVAGAGKGLLVLQFLGESMLIVVISGLIALFLVQVSLPAFDLLISKQLEIPFTSVVFWLVFLLFMLVTGFLAGSYPAFFLSSFKPVAVLKGTFKKMHALVTPRKILVVLQFSFAIVLIIATLVVADQIRYAQNRRSGYDRNQLVYHFLTGNLNQVYPLVKNELIESGIASAVNRTGSPLTESWGDSWDFTWAGKSPDDKTVFDSYYEDEGLIKTAGLQMLHGRDMDLKTFPNDSSAILLNESAVKAMSFKNPLGQLIRNGDFTYHVVGVFKDFLINSPYDPLKPMVIQGASKPNVLNVINIRLSGKNNTGEAIKKISVIFAKYNPDYPFESHFYDEQYAIKFSETRRTGILSALFAGLTIFITCLGLFGLASFTAVQRTKEIGIRKVLGASAVDLWKMLSADFIRLVFISLLIATPAAYYFMYSWLKQYPYHTTLSWWIFAIAGAGALTVTILTVSYQSIKSALSNPVDNLRTE